MAKQEVWRKVDGQAVRCTECWENKKQQLYADEKPVGVEYDCTAKDGVCVFMHKKPDNDKWYGSFREAFDDISAEEAAEMGDGLEAWED